MKVKNLIKADFFFFFANSDYYGFSSEYDYTRQQIWEKVIKPNIKEVVKETHILNHLIIYRILDIRISLEEYVVEWYGLLK